MEGRMHCSIYTGGVRGPPVTGSTNGRGETKRFDVRNKKSRTLSTNGSVNWKRRISRRWTERGPMM